MAIFSAYAFLVIFISQMAATVPHNQILLTPKKRPFVPRDLVSLDRLGPLIISPDGNKGVFTKWSFANDTASTHLWTLSISNGAIEALTDASPGVTESSPIWIDASRIVFMRKESQKTAIPQIYSISLNSKKPKPVLDQPLPISVGNLKYNHPRKFLTFTAEVYSNAASSLQDTFEQDKMLEQSTDSAMVFDHLFFRHWDSYDNHKQSHIFVLPLSVPSVGPLNSVYASMFNLLKGLTFLESRCSYQLQVR